MKRLVVGMVIVGAAVLLAAGATYGFVKFNATTSKASILAKLKKDVARDLHDPESVRFRDLRLLTESDHFEGLDKWFQAFPKNQNDLLKVLRENPKSFFRYDERFFSLCGQINAKNRLGAYTGYSNFYIANTDPAKPLVVIEGLGWDKDFIDKMCEIGTAVQTPPDDLGK